MNTHSGDIIGGLNVGDKDGVDNGKVSLHIIRKVLDVQDFISIIGVKIVLDLRD